MSHETFVNITCSILMLTGIIHTATCTILLIAIIKEAKQP